MNRKRHIGTLFTLLIFTIWYIPCSAQDGQWDDQQSDSLSDSLSENVNIDESLLLEPGELPDYDFLRLKTDRSIKLVEDYLQSYALFVEDVSTTEVVFAEVPDSSRFSRMTLDRLVAEARETNLTLINSRRDVEIARSSSRSAEARFIPFLDLVASSRYQEERDANATTTDAESGETKETVQRSQTGTSTAGFETGVDLNTGGQIRAEGFVDRVDSNVNLGPATTTDQRDYSSKVEVRYIQPLLRGGGIAVGTADRRRARLQEMSDILSDRITQRDEILSVIQTYFEILQSARQLGISRDAIERRLVFLDETTQKYNFGRVDESEILRAEIDYLNELETAIGRRRSLDESREDMLILLGIPLDTEISFLDVSRELAGIGRVDIPSPEECVAEAVNNRPELILSDISVALAEIDLELAKNDVLPELNFDAGYTRFDSSTNESSEGIGLENSGWDAGVDFRLPLPNIEAREALKRSYLSLEQRRTNRLAQERNLIRGVLSARRNVLTTESQLTILSKSVEQARRSLELIRARFEVGFANVTEVRLAQDDLVGSETRYGNALLNYQISLAQLYVALGRPLV